MDLQKGEKKGGKEDAYVAELALRTAISVMTHDQEEQIKT